MQQSSEGTQRNHRVALNALVRHCGVSRSVTLLTKQDFEDTIDLLRRPPGRAELTEYRLRKRNPRRGRSEMSLNIDRAALRSFVAFLHAAGYLPAWNNPAIGLKSAPAARKPGGKRAPLARDGAARLLDLAGEQHPRDRVACALALFAGLRESEIIELRWRDIRWHDPSGPVMDFYRPKRRDAHRVAISPVLERELRAWWTWYAERHPDMRGEWYVVPARRRGGYTMTSGRGQRLIEPMSGAWPVVPDQRAHSVRKSIKPLFAKAGVDDLFGKGVHTLRRTFANMLREESGDIRVVQHALGHRSQLTTEIYMDHDREYEQAAKVLQGWSDPLGTREALPDNVRPMWRRSG